jgi:SAM-dependent methyltransferase
MIYQSINRPVFDRIPAGTSTLLDVGCGGGVFGAAVKAAMPCTVVGVTFSEAEALQARQRIDRVEVADLNGYEPAGLGEFDCIVCSHVLEHLHDPRQTLARLRTCLRQGGSLIVALPNVLFWKQRLQFLRGRFEYTEGGLMDRTHVRFFDWLSAQQLVVDAGFVVREGCADGGVPLSNRFGTTLSTAINRAGLARFPGVFGFQFVFRCEVAEKLTGTALSASPRPAKDYRIREPETLAQVLLASVPDTAVC